MTFLCDSLSLALALALPASVKPGGLPQLGRQARDFEYSINETTLNDAASNKITSVSDDANSPTRTETNTSSSVSDSSVGAPLPLALAAVSGFRETAPACMCLYV